MTPGERTNAKSTQTIPTGRPVVLLIGWADRLEAQKEAIKHRVRHMIDAIVQVVFESGGVLVNGGTDSGVMKLSAAAFGARRRSSRRKAYLIGVAAIDSEGQPAGPINEDQYDLLERVAGGGPGSEAGRMVELAESIADGSPVVALMVGGGPAAHSELQTLRDLGIPTLIVEGCGVRARDRLLRTRLRRTVMHLDKSEPPPRLIQSIRWAVSHSAPLLRDQWLRVASFDGVAGSHRSRLRAGRLLALALGGLTAIAAVLPAAYRDDASGLRTVIAGGVLILAPLLAALTFGWLARRQRDARFTMSRSAAESLKREIYLVRSTPEPDHDEFARRCGQIERTAATATNAATESADPVWLPRSLANAVHPADDLLSPLTDETYAAVRLGHQLAYYEHQGIKRDRSEGKSIALLYLISFATPVLTLNISEPLFGNATGALAFAAVLATFSGAIATYAAYEQWATTSSQMATSAAELRAIKVRKDASAIEIKDLVNETEVVLLEEQQEWLRSMHLAGITLQDMRPGMS